jgi:hypothetical protein
MNTPTPRQEAAYHDRRAASASITSVSGSSISVAVRDHRIAVAISRSGIDRAQHLGIGAHLAQETLGHILGPVWHVGVGLEIDGQDARFTISRSMAPRTGPQNRAVAMKRNLGQRVGGEDMGRCGAVRTRSASA